MNTGIEITPRDRNQGRGQAVRIWPKTKRKLEQLSNESGRSQVEILDLALEQVSVAGQKREAK